MTEADAAQGRQDLGIAEGQREANLQHQRQADDLWARLEVPARGAFGHPFRIAGHPIPRQATFLRQHPSRNFSDSSLQDICDIQRCQLGRVPTFHPRPDRCHIGHRGRGKQLLGVGVLRVGKQRLAVALLDRDAFA